MTKVRVAINGFGRIGRLAARILLDQTIENLELVAINDLTDIRTLVHLLTYDSIHGTYDKRIEIDGEYLRVGKQKVAVINQPDPEKLPWGELAIDVVIEATGRFKERAQIQKQLTAGAKKVVVTAPTKGEDMTLVMGVNDHMYRDDQHDIISAASCTTTCLAPVIKIVHEHFGVLRGLMTTIHSYTNDQVLLDFAHNDLRRSRAAAMSIIPTSTGAAQAVAKVLPEMKGKLSGMALRVPTPNVSCVDLVLELGKPVTAEELNQLLIDRANGEMKDVIHVSELPLVSIDYRGSHYAAIVDALSTIVIDKNLVKLLLWYDNEWGYSYRLIQLISHIAKSRS